MKPEEIMIGEVIQISPDNAIAHAAGRMRERVVGCLVVTVDGAVKGIITDRDLLGCISQGHDPLECKVSTHMSRPVVVLKPEEGHLTAVEVMRTRRIKRLPVAKTGKLVGIVSLSDLAAVVETDLEQLESSRRFISSFIKTQRAQTRPPKLRIAAAEEPAKAANG
jgi:CBS domain-containing protein